MNKYYYGGPDKKPVGPFTAEELRKLADEGKITDGTFVISEGQTNWVRYADWKAAQGTAEAAEAITRKAQQMKTAISKFEFGAAIFGLLLVSVEIVVLPWRLIRRAAVALADWGRSRILPTAQSDLPVATFFVVVLRPAVHILPTVIGGLGVVGYSLHLIWGGISDWAESTGAAHGSVSGGIGTLLGGLALVYFSNILIGLCFDCISIGIVMANSLRNIERK